MASFTKASVENLKNQVNIVDVVGRAVKLKRAGSYFKGLCPFHNEKTPSFTVSDTRQYFTCFGCGARGDVIEFMMRYYNLGFGEAVEKLAEEYGVKLERRSGYRDQNLKEYYDVNQMAARYFYRAFTGGPNPGYSYMKGREITPRILKKFGIGYADGEWDSLYRYLKSNGVRDEIMLELGLVSRSRGKIHDRFRNRVMFPIINTNGKVIGFGGRALEKDARAKYLNSPESKVFLKKNNLYGLNLSRQAAGKEGFLILVEGYMDAISLYQSGVENVSASLGTALTENQARLLHRYTNDVVLSYDADAAGRKAALRGIEILKAEQMRVRVLHVTDGKDPDEYVKVHGKDGFLKLIDGALPYADYKLDSAKRHFDLASSEGRVGYLKEAARIIASLDPVEQEEYRSRVAADMHVSVGALTREVAEVRGGEARDDRFRGRRLDERAAQETEVLREVPALEKTLVKLFLSDGALLREMEKYDGILSHPLSVHVYEAARNEMERTGKIDTNAILDGLTEADCAALQNILRNVMIDREQEQKIFEECVRSWKRNRLKQREKELINILSMADEENEEQTRNLTAELVRIQRELRNAHNH
ncbi:DNA primase [Eubacterium pyruvativorans]|uniref:DNA primase n=1 Tax=Eubacterium pyruvativorans TaxID=155865 RepID=UPI0023F4B96F|nr:DNA primase [Eubacterium pyruvativorans]MCI5747105.1 DNA primase [Eubacterium pyruvativorans]